MSAQGYVTELQTQGPQEQAQLLEAKAISEHERINKGRSLSQRMAFAMPEELQDSIAQLEAMPEGRRFYYRQQSARHPIRLDGQPNRPLTSFSVLWKRVGRYKTEWEAYTPPEVDPLANGSSEHRTDPSRAGSELD